MRRERFNYKIWRRRAAAEPLTKTKPLKIQHGAARPPPVRSVRSVVGTAGNIALMVCVFRATSGKEYSVCLRLLLCPHMLWMTRFHRLTRSVILTDLSVASRKSKQVPDFHAQSLLFNHLHNERRHLHCHFGKAFLCGDMHNVCGASYRSADVLTSSVGKYFKYTVLKILLQVDFDQLYFTWSTFLEHLLVLYLKYFFQVLCGESTNPTSKYIPQIRSCWICITEWCSVNSVETLGDILFSPKADDASLVCSRIRPNLPAIIQLNCLQSI